MYAKTTLYFSPHLSLVAFTSWSRRSSFSVKSGGFLLARPAEAKEAERAKTEKARRERIVADSELVWKTGCNV